MNTSRTALFPQNLSLSRLAPILAVALIGLSMLVVAGHAQANVLHDTAHDTRHATGFPCH